VKYCDLRSLNSLILFEVRKNPVIKGRNLLWYQVTRRVVNVTVVIIKEYNCYQLHAKFYPLSVQGEVHTWTKLLDIIIVGFTITDKLVI
jgi:hypothetical protein